MGYRSYLWIGIGVFLAVAVAICVMAPSAKATNDPPGGGGTISGDWTVTDARSYSSVTITIENGNLAIQAGGTLTLTNVNLRFSPWSGNIYSFTVQQGGTLTVSKGTITSIYSNIHYKFIIKGSATIDGATISEMWGDINSWAGGVQIYSSSASVTNCTITKGMTGGISIFDSSPVIANNKITANGQDGQCTTYCFGLYAWNTKSNIESNLIYENNYQITISSYGYYYEYPGGWDYYSTQWVSMYGEYATYAWYYGCSWWGYTERDIYSETYGQAALYGLGVIIQGGSQATFSNNSVTKNGYHAPGSGGWTYNYYYEGSGYGYCPYMADYGYYEWDNYCDFYVYEQSYSSFSYSNYGKGLIIDNSTVDISGNTFDRNGFEPYHSYYADSNSACYYSGVDITMTNSCGNITGNTINDASILVDLSNSYTNLTNNKMLGDFIGTAPDPVSPVSSNIVPWNAVWCVRANNTQIPNIINNTITLKYMSYPYFYLPNQRGFAASAVALDLGIVKVPTLMQNNKITVDDQYYGSCPGQLIRMDLRANLDFWDNSLEYKRANMYISGLANTYLLTAGNANIVNVQNCSFKGPYTAFSTLPQPSAPTANTLRVSGIFAPLGPTLTILNSTFTGLDYGVHASYGAKVTIDGDTFSSGGLSLQCLYADTVSLRNTTFSSDYLAFQASAAVTADLYNVSFKTCDYAIQETDYSSLTLNAVSITGSKTVSLIADGGCKAIFDKCTANGNGIGIKAINSRILVGNSTLGHASEFYMDKGSIIDVFNTPYTSGGVTLLDAASWLRVYWPITIQVVWQDDAPVEGAKVSLATMMGAPIYSGTTGPTGAVGSVLWVKEFEAHNFVVTTYTPHRVTVSKGRITTMDLYIVDKPLDIVFRLTDSIPPELIVSTPQDNQLFNDSMVTVKGKASDQEAGLLNEQVVINIDNTGWIAIPVTDGAWAFQRPLSDGVHIIQVRAEDLVHNLARVSLTVSVDTTAPVLQVFTPIENSFTNQRTTTVTGLSDDDAFVTVNGIQVPVSKRFFSAQISLESGLNTIMVAASDPSGNARTVVVHVNLDTLAPILEVTSPKPGIFTNQDPVSVIGTTEPTAQVKVNGVRAQLNGTSFESLVDLSEGANSITLTAVDLAGNLNTLSLIVYLDTAAPDLTVFTPRDELWTNQTKILVTGATEQGASMLINGQNVNVQNTVFSFYANLIEGPNHIEMTAKDAAGNTKSLGRTVYVDTQPPELIVTAPLDRTYTGSRIVPVIGSVDYGSEVRINGERMNVNDFVFSTSMAFTSDGTQVIEITARDLAGNMAMVTRTVNVDTSQPFIIISSPVDNTSIPHRMITVSGQTEPGATIVVNTETVVQVGIDGLFSVPVVLEDGVNRITVKAMDMSGNGQTASVTVTKPKSVQTSEDVSWALNLTGVLIGIGIALPVATYFITDTRRKTRAKLITELEAAEQERKEKDALSARMAAMPTVERLGKKKAPKAPPKEQPPQQPPEMSTPPVPEAPATPEIAKAGLKDKSGTEEVSAEDTEQASKIEAPKAPSAVEAPETPAQPADATLKDKGTEAEGAAGETDIGDVQRRP